MSAMARCAAADRRSVSRGIPGSGRSTRACSGSVRAVRSTNQGLDETEMNGEIGHGSSISDGDGIQYPVSGIERTGAPTRIPANAHSPCLALAMLHSIGTSGRRGSNKEHGRSVLCATKRPPTFERHQRRRRPRETVVMPRVTATIKPPAGPCHPRRQAHRGTATRRYRGCAGCRERRRSSGSPA